MGRELRITVFDTGFFKIPALRFVAHQGKLMDTINTLPLYFEILPVKADSTIRDIKSNLKAPVNLKEVLYFLWKNYPIIALAIGLCIAVVLIVRYIRRKLRKGRITEREVIQELPEVVALRELEKIRNEKSWLHGRIKVFHIRLSEILRTYIEGHFKVMALELTTDEILRELKSPVCQSSELSKLAGILKLADLVKFAKAIPTEEENALQVNLATEFVQNTSKPGEEITGDTSIEKDSITTALITDNA
jgi:hypothetical protein